VPPHLLGVVGGGRWIPLGTKERGSATLRNTYSGRSPAGGGGGRWRRQRSRKCAAAKPSAAPAASAAASSALRDDAGI